MPLRNIELNNRKNDFPPKITIKIASKSSLSNKSVTQYVWMLVNLRKKRKFTTVEHWSSKTPNHKTHKSRAQQAKTEKMSHNS